MTAMLDYLKPLRVTPAAAGLCVLASALCLFFCAPAQSEEIRSFDSTVRLQKDGQLDVTELIEVDFEGAQRHGIYRIIPVQYERKIGTFTVELAVDSVTSEKGQPRPFAVSHSDRHISIKIGDPSATVTGINWYKLHYIVKRAVNIFNGKPEVYWNVTGNEWPFPIDKVTAHLYPPQGVDAESIRAECFVGAAGSKTPGAARANGHEVIFQSSKLAAGEGMTILAQLPQGAVVLPTFWQEAWWFLLDWYPVLVLPAITAVALYTYWWFYGRDEDGGKAISVEFDPPKELTPCEVGTLIDESCDMPDITSTIVDLAARGYLKIKEIPYNGILMMSDKDYLFTRTSPNGINENPLRVHETLVLNGIFGLMLSTARLSELRGKFYHDIEPIKRSVYDSMVSRDYFARDPSFDRHLFTAFCALITIPGALLAVVGPPDMRASAVGFLLSGIMVGLSSGAMPRRTARGSKLLRQALSFQRFVKAAEKERIRVLADQDPTVFGRLLPYAMVLGCAERWADAFQDLMAQPPEWFESQSSSRGDFSTMLFYDDLFRGMDTMRYTLSSAMPNATSIDDKPGGGGWGGGAGSGSSGFDVGGFVGGGFGGGGGGSW